MKQSFLLTAASALVALPLAVSAETINLYGWQNHSWEFVDIENGREFDRIQGNAANIGFAASVDTGMNGIHVNLQCEQFTYVNQFAGGTGWCNRNSKIGLAHPALGEIMFATWLLPYNEAVAQWVDPFYDAGADSHTSIMGSVGAGTIFYNTGQFDASSSGIGQSDTRLPSDAQGEFNYADFGWDQGFNRRQENIIQYWSPNVNGFVFRYAQTVGLRDNSPTGNGVGTIAPSILSTSLAYENGPFWAAATYQEHEDWAAARLGNMNTSAADSYRFAARYIMDMGNGMSIQLSAMYENLEYEFRKTRSSSENMVIPAVPARTEVVTRVDDDGNQILDGIGNPIPVPAVETHVTTGVDVMERQGDGTTATIPVHVLNPDPESVEPAGNNVGDRSMEVPLTRDRQVRVDGIPQYDEDGMPVYELDVNGERVQEPVPVYQTRTIAAVAERVIPLDTGIADAMRAFGYSNFVGMDSMRNYYAATGASLGNGSITFERDAFLISGKIKFGGPLDFRFSYMDADDLEIRCVLEESATGECASEWDDTAADAWNVGLYYTLPAGTELRLTYSEVSNDANGTYGQGISGTGLGTPGGEVEMIAIGIVHWFD